MSIETLMHANLLEVFNERDASLRQAAIESTYAPDVRWTDSEGVVTGRDALEAKCVELQAGLGPLQFQTAGPLHQLPGFGFLAWQLVDPNGQTQVTGFDACIIEGDLIAQLFTVVNPPAA
jgi:hypothetical protein